jgi:predicted ATPase
MRQSATIEEGQHKQRFYGRSEEVARLREIYDQTIHAASSSLSGKTKCSASAVAPSTRLVLLSGSISGVGKRALINESLSSLQQENGLLITARFRRGSAFDQFASKSPSPLPHQNALELSTLCRATEHGIFNETAIFDSITRCALHSALWAHFSTRALDRELLVELFPKLAHCCEIRDSDWLNATMTMEDSIKNCSMAAADGESTVLPPLSGLQDPAVERRYVLVKLWRVVATVLPTVLVLEQAHWANIESLQALESLLNSCHPRPAEFKGILVILCYSESTNGSDSRAFEEFLSGISFGDSATTALLRESDTVRYSVLRIRLNNLTKSDIVEWTTEQWGLPLERDSHDMLQSVGNLVYEKSNGNPRFVTLLLTQLQSLDDILFEEWLETIPPNSHDLFVWILQQQDSSVRHVIDIIAVLGARGNCASSSSGGDANCPLVDLVLQRSCQDDLITAHQCGLLIVDPVDQTVRFPSPDLEAVTYSLIPDSMRATCHLKIGRRLWKNSSMGTSNEDSSLIFVVADNLRLGVDLCSDVEDLDGIIMIILEAGKQAMKASLFTMAVSYFNWAISALDDRLWSSACYDITLALFNCGSEAYYCIADFATMDRLLDSVFRNAKTFQDKIHAYTTLIYSYGARNRVQEAFTTAFDVLRSLGEPLPAEPSNQGMILEYLRTSHMLRGKTDRFFLNLPVATDTDKIAIMQMLFFAVSYAYVVKAEWGMFALCRMIRLSLQDGIAAPLFPALGAYSYILCAQIGRVAEGIRFGQIALALLQQHQSRSWLARTFMLVHGLSNRWGYPFRCSLEPLLTAHRLALKTGDMEGSLATAAMYLDYAFHAGTTLFEIEKETRYACVLANAVGQKTCLIYLVPKWRVVADLIGADLDPLILKCDVADSRSALAWAIKESNQMAVAHFYLNQCMFQCLIGCYEECCQMAKKRRQSQPAADVWLPFYSGLASLALARTTSGVRRFRYIFFGRSAAKDLRRQSRVCPANFTNKFSLLEAEILALKGKPAKAMALFEKSISAAKYEGFIHEEGLALERLALYHLHLGNAHTALSIFEKARDAYCCWGAGTLVQRMNAHLTTLHHASALSVKR